MIDLAAIPEAEAALAQLLHRRLVAEPSAPAVVVIHQDGTETSLTVADLWQSATAWAARWRAARLPVGGLLVLAMGHGTSLLGAIWGAWLADLVPSIFPYLDDARDPAAALQQLHFLAASAGAAGVVLPTGWSTRPEVAPLLAAAEVFEPVPTDGMAVAAVPAARRGGEDLAYIQYTSGTTGLSKGVALSHRAILNYVRAQGQTLQASAKDRMLNWLPLYHDMGLFGGLIFPISYGFPTILLSPQSWVRRPLSLLQAAHRHRATICLMAGFGLSHTARTVRDRDLEGIELGTVRRFICGAEPIRQAALQAFRNCAASAGLVPSALAVAYGLAENTLTTTMTARQEDIAIDWVDPVALHGEGRARPVTEEGEARIPITSCGRALPGVTLRVVDAQSRVVGEREVGEVLIRSASLFSGYYQRPELTAAAMEDGWYRSGDLGYLAAGQLYICGRKKDLIIVGGRNIHPEDLEAIAGSLPGIRADRTAAFAVDDEQLGTEKAVIVAELDRYDGQADAVMLEKSLRRLVTAQVGITLAGVRFVPRGWIEFTANHKLSRHANRRKYLELFGSAAASSPTQPE